MFWQVAALSLMFVVSSAAPAPSGWQQLGPGHYLCTEAAGQYDNYEIAPLQPQTPLTVRLKMVTENFDPDWTVEAAIFFDTPKGRSRVTVGKANDDRDHIYVALQPANTLSTYWDILAKFPVSSDWIDLTLSLDDHGVVHVMSGTKEGKLKLKSAGPVKTMLHCNSGVFEVELVPPVQI